MKPLLLRYSWFVTVGAFFFHHDMCLGGGNNDPEPAPQKAPPDASPDARLDQATPAGELDA